MKRLAVSTLFVSGALLLSGCGNKVNNNEAASPSPKVSTAVQPEDVASWQTSKSEYNDFEIKHPKGWTFAKSHWGQELELSAELGHSIGIAYHENLTDINPQYTSLDKYMASSNFREASAITFKGDNGFTAKMDHEVGTNKFIESLIIIKHSNHIYVINFVDDPKYGVLKKQIVDTLEFIEF